MKKIAFFRDFPKNAKKREAKAFGKSARAEALRIFGDFRHSKRDPQSEVAQGGIPYMSKSGFPEIAKMAFFGYFWGAAAFSGFGVGSRFGRALPRPWEGTFAPFSLNAKSGKTDFG